MKARMVRLARAVPVATAVLAPVGALYGLAQLLSGVWQAETNAAFMGAAASFYFIILHDLWKDRHVRYTRAYSAGAHLEFSILRALESLAFNEEVFKKKQEEAAKGIPVGVPFELFELRDDEVTDLFTVEEANRVGLVAVRARELKTNLSSLDAFLRDSIQAALAKRMADEDIQSMVKEATSLFQVPGERMIKLKEMLHSLLAYFRVRGKKAKPTWMRTLWWTLGQFSPKPSEEEIELELVQVRRDLVGGGEDT